MNEPYLEVTFHRGRALAAYLYLPRQADEKSAWTKRVEPGMVIDFGPSGNPIGIEITAPEQTSRGPSTTPSRLRDFPRCPRPAWGICCYRGWGALGCETSRTDSFARICLGHSLKEGHDTEGKERN